MQLLVNRKSLSVIPEVSISRDSSGSPGTIRHTLTNPSALPLHTDDNTFELTTFTAPDNSTLAADTTYWLVTKVKDTGSLARYAVKVTDSDDETSNDSPEWKIADVTSTRLNDAAWDQNLTTSIQMNIQGKLINPPGVIAITPEDPVIGTHLMASLTDEDGGVTNIRWQWARSNDGETNWTNISDARTNTYTLTYANRGQYLQATAFYDDNHGPRKTASGIIEGPPALALVSNTGETSTASITIFVNVANNKKDYATSFHTGNNPDGYALTSVQLLVNRKSLSIIPEVSISRDSSGSPGTVRHTLTNPSALPLHTDDSTFELTTFTAPDNSTLAADTTYWMVLKATDTGSLARYVVKVTDSDDETSNDSPEWKIADVTSTRLNDAAWDQNLTTSIQMNIQGKLINPPGVVALYPPTPNVDNTLTASLTDPDGGITNVRWQWSISDDGETGWTNISGATSSIYTPIDDDSDRYLRAIASYGDNHGSGKTAEGVTDRPVHPIGITLTLDPGMFAYEFHATEYDPLGDFRFQWKSTDVTGPDNALWPTYDQFKPTHDVENFCAMPGITREGAMECGWEYVSPGSGVSSQLATLVTKHANREYDFRIVGELREGGELFSNIIRAMVAPDPDLSDATERGIKAWRVDTAGHFIVEWRLTQSCDAGKQFYIRTEDSSKFAWGTGGRNQHGRLLFTDNATFDEDENDVATEVSIYCATSREDTNQGHIYAAADIAAKGADPVLGTEATR